jgi:Restriction endonuclease
MPNQSEEWKRFEVVIAEIQKQLAPQADVHHNQKIVGQSGRRRQLDVAITQKVGPYPILIVLECRRRTRPVSIEGMEAFSRKLKDVRAALGVMVSTAGFAEGAQAIARQDNIMLMTYRQAQDADWHALLGEPAWMAFVLPRFTSESIVAVVQGGKAIPISAGTLVMDRSHTKVATAWGIFEELIWPSLSKEQAIGPREVSLEANDDFDIQHGNERLPLERIQIRGTLSQVRHVINLRLASGDVLESGTTGPVFTRVTSEGFDWAAALARSSGVLLSQDEWERLSANPGQLLIPLDMSKVQKYLRLDIEVRKDG